jgi:RNA polymerase sigma factor (sigma-70 family)
VAIVTATGDQTDETDEIDESDRARAIEFDAMVVASSFDEFFTAHHAEMVRALSLALGDVELGRDAASEGFARALQRWGTVSRYANPGGWVYRVGLNWARSRWRRLRRESSGEIVDHAAASIAPRDLTLFAALQRLSADHRAVVVGRYYLDWSEAQLAAALDIASGTVKSRLSRGLAQLADLLEDDHGST